MNTRKHVKRERKYKSTTRGGGKILRTRVSLSPMRRLAITLPKFQEFKKSIENTPVYFIFCHGSYVTSYYSRPGRVFTESEKAHNTPSFKLSDSTYILHASHINEFGSIEQEFAKDGSTVIKETILDPIVVNQQINNFRKILLVNDRTSDVEGLKKAKKGYNNFIANLSRATSCDYPNQLCTFVDNFDIKVEEKKAGKLVESDLEKKLGIYSLDSIDFIMEDIRLRKGPEFRGTPPTSKEIFDNDRYSLIKTAEYGTPGRLGPDNNGVWFLDEIIEYVYNLQKNEDDFDGTPKGIFLILSCSAFDPVGHRLGWSIDKVQKMVTDADNMYKSNELDIPLLDINEMKIAKENSWIPRSIIAKDYYHLSANEERAMNDPEHRIEGIEQFFPTAKFFPPKP